MITTAKTDSWIYAGFPLATPDAMFGRFAPAVTLWRSKAAGGGLPRKRAFAPEDFRGWHGWVIMYDIQPAPFDLRFRLFGSYLAEGLRIENTGKLFSQAYAHVPDYTVTLQHFHTLWGQRLIGMSSGPMGWEGLDFHSGLFIDLPVADDDDTLAYFFTFAALGDQSISAEMPTLADGARDHRLRTMVLADSP